MKVLLVVFAIIGVTYGTVAGGFEAISNHMPKALMRAAVEISNEGDAETQSLVREIQTPAFQAYITNIKASREFIDIITSLESQGVGAAAIVQAYIDFFLQLPPRNTNGFISGTRGLMDKIRGYLDDVKMIEYIAGVKESNAAFRDYIIQLGNSREAFNTVRNMADTKAVVVILQRYHIDTDYIVSLIQLLFGWQ